jgi:hypothetical protein
MSPLGRKLFAEPGQCEPVEVECRRGARRPGKGERDVPCVVDDDVVAVNRAVRLAELVEARDRLAE